MKDTAWSHVKTGSVPALLLCFLIQMIRAQPAVSGTVVTCAGAGAKGFSGDGGPVAKAQFNDPSGIVRGRDGTLYICDTANHRIRKVTPDGKITTVAGTGEPGWTGAGGPATAANLNDRPEVRLHAPATPPRAA